MFPAQGVPVARTDEDVCEDVKEYNETEELKVVEDVMEEEDTAANEVDWDVMSDVALVLITTDALEEEVELIIFPALDLIVDAEVVTTLVDEITWEVVAEAGCKRVGIDMVTPMQCSIELQMGTACFCSAATVAAWSEDEHPIENILFNNPRTPGNVILVLR